MFSRGRRPWASISFSALSSYSAFVAASLIRVPANRGIVGVAFASGQVVHVPDAYADERFNREVDRATGFTTRDVLAAERRR